MISLNLKTGCLSLILLLLINIYVLYDITEGHPPQVDDMYWYLSADTGSDVAAEARASIGAKCGGIVVMFLLPFLFGLTPLKAAKMKNAERYTNIASCFGGGVFFGTCFLHLIPEVNFHF